MDATLTFSKLEWGLTVKLAATDLAVTSRITFNN